MSRRRNNKDSAAKEAKVMTQMEDMCKSGDSQSAYEALQMYRSKSNRHIHKGDKCGAADKEGMRAEYDQAVGVLTAGTIALGGNGYDTAALELAEHAVQLLQQKGIPMDETLKRCVTQMDDSFDVGSKSRGTFLKQVIKWDRAYGSRVLGDPLLHARLAFNQWENELTQVQATHHFALGEAPDRLAAKLENVKDELTRDRLLLMGVLNFLGIENLRDATALVTSFKKARKEQYKDKKNDYVQSKLVRFCDQLVRLCCRDAAPLFQKLCTSNAKDLSFEDSIPVLIKGPIASVYFNIPAERALNPMLQALLGGMGR